MELKNPSQQRLILFVLLPYTLPQCICFGQMNMRWICIKNYMVYHEVSGLARGIYSVKNTLKCTPSPGILVSCLCKRSLSRRLCFLYLFMTSQELSSNWPTWNVQRWPIFVQDNKSIPRDWHRLLGTLWPDSNFSAYLSWKIITDRPQLLSPRLICLASIFLQKIIAYLSYCLATMAISYLNRCWIRVSQLQWVSGSTGGIWLHKCMGTISITGATELLLSSGDQTLRSYDQTLMSWLRGKGQLLSEWKRILGAKNDHLDFLLSHRENISGKMSRKALTSSKWLGKCEAVITGLWSLFA